MASSSDTRALLALLGVDERASWEEVRGAFRDVVRATHPDLHAGDPDAERRLKTVNAAWERVKTPRRWSQHVARSNSAAGPHGPAPGPPMTTEPPLGRLRVLRQRAGSAGLRRWKLELDGEVVTTIVNGGASLLEARPGEHSLRVFYESCSSRPLTLALRASDELTVGCRQQPNPLLSLYAPGRSLVLELIGSRRLDLRTGPRRR